MEKDIARVRKLRDLATLMDSKFKGPFGTSFGFDALIGLIPGLGDMITASVSLIILVQAAFLGVGAATLVRMGLNILVENVFDFVPLVGNLFDFYWKANIKNIELLEQHLANPGQQSEQSRIVVGTLCALLFSILSGVLLLAAYFSWWILSSIYYFIASFVSA